MSHPHSGQEMATAVMRNTLSSSSSSSTSSPASSMSASSNDDSFVTAGTSGASTRPHNQIKNQSITGNMYASKLVQSGQQPSVTSVNDDTDDDGDSDDESMADRVEPVSSIVVQLKSAHIRDSKAAAKTESKMVDKSDSTDDDDENEVVSEEESDDEEGVDADKEYGLDDFQIIRTIGKYPNMVSRRRYSAKPHNRMKIALDFHLLVGIASCHKCTKNIAPYTLHKRTIYLYSIK